ncbi:MAG: prepilin-type N-terminal cleavage/methylation domain-containing protein [Candidatus Binatia bacterium]
MRRPSGGFTLVELLVALLVLSVAALGLASTLASTGRALSLSRKWMQATQLAAEGMEQLRAGQALGSSGVLGGFERSVVTAPWDGHPALQRLEVTVSWNDGEAQTFRLVTLVRR